LLGLTHASVDLNPSALAALLPAFYLTFHLTFGEAALITAVSQIANSAAQLPFGYLADRTSVHWFIPTGCVVAGLGLALAGTAPSYALLLLCICLSGLGVAMFHPEAARRASQASGRRRATGMSLFSVGGNAGFALGPLAAALVVGLARPGSSLLFLVPSALVLLTLRLLGWAATRRAAPAALEQPGSNRRRGGRVQLTLLMVVTILRSALQIGILTMVPLYEVTVRHQSQAFSSALMTAFLGAGAAGTIVGGMVADRFGRRTAVLGSFMVAAPLLLIFRTTAGLPAFMALTLAGGVLLSTFAVTVVMGQELLPNRTGVAAGLTIGLASGIGGATVALLGHVADVTGLPTVLTILVVLTILAGACSLGLASEREAVGLTGR
jgi:FSR family fosmidomycin resistance protein-like MFS transporter